MRRQAEKGTCDRGAEESSKNGNIFYYAARFHEQPMLRPHESHT